MTQNKEYMLQRVNNLLLHADRKKIKQDNLTEANLDKIKKLKDIHKGKRCFIIGGAPSLKLLDLSKLNDEMTFTVNRGYKLKERGLKNSKYHIIVDRLLPEDAGIMEEIPIDFSKSFFINSEIDFKKNGCDCTFVEILNSNMLYFQEDLTKPLMTIGTVISQAIQIAYYMGFNEIYLIGVDLDFSKNPGHFYESSKEENFRQATLSVKGEDVMLKGMETITNFLNSKGVNIYNSSPAGCLDCMPRVKYEELF